MPFIKDNDVVYLQGFSNNDVILECYDTTTCKYYDNDYMMMIVRQNTCNNLFYYSYYTDKVDMIALYDMIISNF